MQCPGQDTRFWQPEDIFDVACESCGTPVEFFKTDPSRLCPQCGARIQNPKVSLGCAKWCAYAKDCLGYDPNDLDLPDTEEYAFVDRLIDAMREAFDGEADQITHALLVLERAQGIMRDEGGDAKVVMAAALLHDVGLPTAERKHGSSEPRFHEVEGAAIARQVMESLDMDDDSIDHVCRIVRSHHSADDVATAEFNVVWDADRLEETPAEVTWQDEDRVKRLIDKVFRTEAGKRQAHRLLLE